MTVRRRVRSFTDMGALLLSHLRQGIILTDRDDGTEWLLSFNDALYETDDGLGYFSIDTAIPHGLDVYTYEAYGEPTFTGGFRLLVRGGYLGYEIVDWDTGTTKRVLGIDGFRAVFREIIVPSTWQREGDMLAWQEVAQ